ncbi:MAG TPA: Holliday junction resolvase RuvX [Candidatus Saccharibacteria bacterium]|nr:Holliday junction resolvase RuvX [Candidatus Saccharibacteria bacterium]HMT39432.1 Holliday junction resolvase RuvX [Candidatus Saccharibacteria bacterium]
MTVILGFDFGLKRTGVAIAKDNIAEPLATLDADALESNINNLIEKYHPAELVVGIPRNLEGEDTAQTKLARQFGENLARTSGLPVKYQDEALSSERALQRIGQNTPIATRKKMLDQISAQIILEDYLK